MLVKLITGFTYRPKKCVPSEDCLAVRSYLEKSIGNKSARVETFGEIDWRGEHRRQILIG